jgi:hypothetical protein
MPKRRKASRPREVFLSHSSKDHVAAKRLAKFLQARGIRIWFAPAHLLGAQQWHDEIGKALARCDWFVVLLSPDAVKSEWVKRELQYAIRERRYIGRIVPAVLKQCQLKRLSWTLGALQQIQFERRFQSGCREFLRIWGIRVVE